MTDALAVQATGDASGATKATGEVIKAIDKLISKQADLNKTLNDASAVAKLSQQQVAALRNELSSTTTKIEGMSRQGNTLGGSLKGAKEGAEKAAGAVNALSGAMGQAGGTAGKLAAGFGQVAGLLSAGGPIGIALAAAGVAMIAMNAIMDDQIEKEEKLAKVWQDAINPLTKLREEAAKGLESAQTEGRTIDLQQQGFDPKSASAQAAAENKLREVQEQRNQSETAYFDTRKKIDATFQAEIAYVQKVRNHYQDQTLGATSLLAAEEARKKALLEAETTLRTQRDITSSIFGTVSATVDKTIENAAKQKKSNDDNKNKEAAKDFAEERAVIQANRLILEIDAGKAFLQIDRELGNFAETLDGATEVALADLLDIPTEVFIEAAAASDRLALANRNAALAAEQLAAAQKQAAIIKEVGGAIAGGSGGKAIGSMAGGLAGGAIASVIATPAAAPIGAEIGSILGSVFGDSLDKIIETLGVLTPLFDGVAEIISGLNPILIVVREMFRELAPVWSLLGSIIKDLALIVAPLLVANLKPLIQGFIYLTGIVLLGVKVMTTLWQYTVKPFADALMMLVNLAINPIIKAFQELARFLNETFDLDIQTTAGKPGVCFAAGTLVDTPSGKVAIEDLKVGEEVTARDVERGENTICRITKTMSHLSDHRVTIVVGDEVIETTEEHPFWHYAKEGARWSKAGDLVPGDVLSNIVGLRPKVRQTGFFNVTTQVFNIEVAGDHTYFVGNSGILVHNKDDKRQELLEAKDEARKRDAIERAKDLITEKARKATEENTDALRSFGRDVQNLPAGYKTGAREFQAEIARGNTVTIGQLIVQSNDARTFQRELQQLAQRGFTFPGSTARTSITSERG